MDINNVLEITQEYMVPLIMAICFILGEMIKRFDNDVVNDKYIPVMLPILGIFLATWIEGFLFTPEILLKGLASGWASTGMFEAIKTVFKKGE